VGNFVKHITPKNYTTVPNSVIDDPAIDIKGAGMFFYLFRKAENWNFSELGIVADRNRLRTTSDPVEGRALIRAALLQLEKAGYLVREQVRKEQGVYGNIIYHLFDNKSDGLTYQQTVVRFSNIGKKSCKSPLFDFPTSDKPTSDNPTQYNTTTSYKYINNNMERIDKEKKIVARFEDTYPGFWQNTSEQIEMLAILIEHLDSDQLNSLDIEIFIKMLTKSKYIQDKHDKRAYVSTIFEEKLLERKKQNAGGDVHIINQKVCKMDENQVVKLFLETVKKHVSAITYDCWIRAAEIKLTSIGLKIIPETSGGKEHLERSIEKISAAVDEVVSEIERGGDE